VAKWKARTEGRAGPDGPGIIGGRRVGR
jgi:hypothetical protein